MTSQFNNENINDQISFWKIIMKVIFDEVSLYAKSYMTL